MSDKSTHSFRGDDDLWDEFTSWVEDKEGQKHGEIGRHVENALAEYINADRQHRVERNQEEIKEQLDEVLTRLNDSASTHTHKDQTECNRSDLVTEIHDELVNNHGQAVKNDTVEETIIEIAELNVGDPRTLDRYKARLRQRGLLFEHPGEPPLWTADTSLWAKWASGAAASVSDLEAACEPYPANVYENGNGPQIEIQKGGDE